MTIHGNLVNILGIGVLILGESGTGKSESSLKLISRGFQLVADDVVELAARGGRLFGRSPDPLVGILASRIEGFVDVPAAFGKASVVDESRIDMVIELASAGVENGLERKFLGVTIPAYPLDPAAHRSAALFIENLACAFRSTECDLSKYA